MRGRIAGWIERLAHAVRGNGALVTIQLSSYYGAVVIIIDGRTLVIDAAAARSLGRQIEAKADQAEAIHERRQRLTAGRI